MKFSAVLTIHAAFMVLAAVLSGSVSAQPLVSPVHRGANASAQPFILAQTDYGGEFDLNYCQWECRMRYGLEPTGMGGAGGIHSNTEDGDGAYETHQSSAIYHQHAACIADCNRTFWQQFEKKTRSLQ